MIMLTTHREQVPGVPDEGWHFEWFISEEGRSNYFDKVSAWNLEDAEKHDDVAYLTVEITDTDGMMLGRASVAPRTPIRRSG